MNKSLPNHFGSGCTTHRVNLVNVLELGMFHGFNMLQSSRQIIATNPPRSPQMDPNGGLVREYTQIWVVVTNIFYFHPYLGKISILTNIFQMG